MRIALIIISIVGLYCLYQGIRFAVLVRTSARLVQQSVPFEQIIESGDPRILFVGDSTAVGTGVDHSMHSTAGRFGQEFPGAFIQNVSENGWKVADALEHFRVASDQQFDLVVLQIGANDIIRNTPLPEFTRDLTKLFTLSRAAGNQVVALHSGNIGLAPLFPWPLSSVLSARTRRYREGYMRIATEQGVRYVDLYKEKDADPFYGKDGFYAEDQLHLTAKGYGYWYDQIRAAMKDQ